jgi:hypothetical protein
MIQKNNYIIILLLFFSLFIPFIRFFAVFLYLQHDIISHHVLSRIESIRSGTTDFYYFWGVGNLIDNGYISQLKDFHFYSQYLSLHATNHVMETSYWAYMPTYNFIICFLGFFPYFIGYLIWIFSTIFLFYFACSRFIKDKKLCCLLVFSPASIITYHYAQNSVLLLSLIISGLYYNTMNNKIDFKKDNNMLSGFILGLVSIKFPIFILIPIYLFLSKSWKTLFYTITTSILLILFSIIVFGLQSWYDYFDVLAPTMSHAFQSNAVNASFARICVSPFIVFRMMNFSLTSSWIFQILISLSSVILIFVSLKKQWFKHKIDQIAFFLPLVLISTPYSHLYDLVFLSFSLYVIIYKLLKANSLYMFFGMFLIWTFLGTTDFLLILNVSYKNYIPLMSLLTIPIVIYFVYYLRNNNITKQIEIKCDN